MSGKAYSALAPYYEQLITSCDYEQWSQYLFNKLNLYAKGKVGCDCACGSGYFTRKLKKAGYDVYGVDACEQMLVEANRLSGIEKLPINYQLQDLKKFKSFKKLNFITVINDGINYISQKDIKTVFKNFYSALDKNGALIFDFSSEYKLRNTVGNNLFGEDTDDVTYIWFNTLFENSVKMELTFFIKDGERYFRKDEEHLQYIHSTNDVLSALKEVGFEVKEILSHLGGEYNDTCDRVNIIAIKK